MRKKDNETGRRHTAAADISPPGKSGEEDRRSFGQPVRLTMSHRDDAGRQAGAGGSSELAAAQFGDSDASTNHGEEISQTLISFPLAEQSTNTSIG